MSKRLNDTGALVARGIRGGDSMSPDAGAARMCRGPRPGNEVVCMSPAGGLEVRTFPEPSAGSESLRGATAYLGERIGGERGR